MYAIYNNCQIEYKIYVSESQAFLTRFLCTKILHAYFLLFL